MNYGYGVRLLLIQGIKPMRVQDLGRLKGPVLLFGGPYSNLHATEALFLDAKVTGFRPDNSTMICTGDIVAYCGYPSETVAVIRQSGCAVVAGNCEKQLAAGAFDCGCGFEEGSACDLLSASWYPYAAAHIGQEDRVWMADLPDVAVFEHKGRRYAVIHGGVSDVSRFLWPTSPEVDFLEEIALIEREFGRVDGVVAGHCGLPFVRQIGEVEWINAGVIGMPANDGYASTRFAVLGYNGVEMRELHYDHQSAHDAMVAAGLTQGYHDGLLYGYWPSEEVLPLDLRVSSLARG